MNNGERTKTGFVYWPAVLSILYVILRIPFIPLGYGADDDAWRVASAGKSLLESGAYSSSRFPGYPLFEIVNSPLIAAGGWYLSNAATIIVSLLLLLVFWKTARAAGAGSPRLLTVLFGFFPLFFINSTNTMDYLWALLFIMLSWYLLLKRRVPLAALCLGVSVGFRLTSCIFAVPFTIYLLFSGRGRSAVPFLSLAAVIALLSFSPPLFTYGLGTFKFYKSPRYELSHIPYFLVYSVGILPAIVLVYGAARKVGPFFGALRGGDPIVLSCTASIIAVLVVFSLAPLEKTYTIPMFPFLFLLMDRFFGRKLLAAFTVLALLYGLVMVEVKDESSLDTIRVAPHIASGLVTRDYRDRREQLRLRERLAPFLVRKFGAEKPALFVTGWRVGLPQLFENAEFVKRTISHQGKSLEIYDIEGTSISVLPGPISRSLYESFVGAGYELAFLEGALRYSRLDSGFETDAGRADIVKVSRVLGGG